jgi:diguanylate cyclase (GGDEF)-like protein
VGAREVLLSNILILEAPGPARDALERALTVRGHRVSCYTDGLEALLAWRAQRHELLLLQAGGGARGAELVPKIKGDAGQAFSPIILLIDGDKVDDRIAALQDVEDAVARPYHPVELAARADAQLRTRRLIDDLRARAVESEARSFTDQATGLRNRLFLNERLGDEWKRAARYSEPLSLLVLSLEGWTPQLERRGDAFRDRVLAQLAQAMRRALRQIDLVTRYGPGELAALLINTHLAGALICGERLRKEIGEVRVDDWAPQVVMGVSFYPGKDVTEPGDLMRMCGEALERARAEGPGSICLIQHQGYLFGR